MSSYFQLRMSYIPNAICILRIILVIPIIDFLWDKQYENALGLIAIAGISDFLDGFLAKRNNWRSNLGAALDPAADKILLVSLFVTLYLMGLVPFWLMATVLLRDFMILFGLALYYYFIEKPSPNPSFISKLNTFLQIFFVLFVIAGQALTPSFDLLIQFTGSLVFLASILSGLDYWISWSIRAKKIITAKAS
ncbi:MAG: CDP-alcohol phosphatidyltransferase family protein [Gammaproteobacteria bacterium]|nr:CDP-alcohol phosphatidyltransferase [Gammaproteobacteria bacterium]MBQ09424.1 CDP-alcohol phosphatidyltransferase [Gammaproteobacteria bacterium]MDP6146410.1 CDP-alcohol phosphatidyltransferase family protein [Gammaproteobacteria bacterium]HJL80280.1 CDP-alcohol phosphatidyltransferase family protein [Gammaproteobacteria bacterium]HJN00701.1 CDP-alcohol phosphatidyltransferase family protein [Gammaproteobacteria bacterium]